MSNVPWLEPILIGTQGDALPHLQSVVMVLLKVILSNVTALITQVNGQNGLQSGYQTQETQNGSLYKQFEVNGSSNPLQPDAVHSSPEELDAVRLQEIMAKAVSGILILLLKWFKVSRTYNDHVDSRGRLTRDAGRHSQIRVLDAIDC